MTRSILLAFALAASTGLAASMVACGSSSSRPAAPGTDDLAATGSGTSSTKRPSKPAKNLQVLPKDMPLDEVTALMKQGVAPGLGVKCSFCHVENDFASDENPHKATARDMLRMVMEVNQTYFEGKSQVTCFTCHQGKEKPETPAGPVPTK